MLIIYWPDVQYMEHSYFDPMMALEERFGDLFRTGCKVRHGTRDERDG